MTADDQENTEEQPANPNYPRRPASQSEECHRPDVDALDRNRLLALPGAFIQRDKVEVKPDCPPELTGTIRPRDPGETDWHPWQHWLADGFSGNDLHPCQIQSGFRKDIIICVHTTRVLISPCLYAGILQEQTDHLGIFFSDHMLPCKRRAAWFERCSLVRKRGYNRITPREELARSKPLGAARPWRHAFKDKIFCHNLGWPDSPEKKGAGG